MVESETSPPRHSPSRQLSPREFASTSHIQPSPTQSTTHNVLGNVLDLHHVHVPEADSLGSKEAKVNSRQDENPRRIHAQIAANWKPDESSTASPHVVDLKSDLESDLGADILHSGRQRNEKRPDRHKKCSVPRAILSYFICFIASAVLPPNTSLYFISFKVPDFLEIPTISGKFG